MKPSRTPIQALHDLLDKLEQEVLEDAAVVLVPLHLMPPWQREAVAQWIEELRRLH